MMVTKRKLEIIHPPLLTQQISAETMPEILEFFFCLLFPPSFLSFPHLSSCHGIITDVVFQSVDLWNRTQGISLAT